MSSPSLLSPSTGHPARQDLFPGLSKPLVIDISREPPPALARVAAIIPCHNRRDDAAALFSDLAALDLSGVDLRIILVDNASTIPLADLPAPALNVDHLRLNTNSGGSGGYSAGLSLALSLNERLTEPEWTSFNPEFVWLVDSDARVPRDTLRALLSAIHSDPRIIAAGPAVADPDTRIPFELGGHINRRNGTFEPMVPGAAGVQCAMSDVGCRMSEDAASRLGFLHPTSDITHPTSFTPHSTSHIPVQYLAACCALIRSDAARAIGPFPDTFLNGDDVEWFIRMSQRTGGRIVAVPTALAYHPRYDRFPTWTRYYATRNAHAPIDAVGAPRMAKFRRAMLDVCRAAQQEMMGRSDLTRLHMLGLKHAAQGRTTGIAPPGVIAVEPSTKSSDLLAALRDRLGSLSGLTVAIHPALGIPDRERAELLDALRVAECTILPLPTCGGLRARLTTISRWLGRARADIALIPARGRPDSWFSGRTLVQLIPGSAAIRAPHRLAAPVRAGYSLVIGTTRAIRIARRPRVGPSPLNPAHRAAAALARGPGRALSVEAIVLSYNRWPALEATIERLLASPAFNGRGSLPGVQRTITVVDNGSRDGTRDRAEAFLAPRGINLIALPDNRGVDAFNTAASRSTADAVLILDDDATPDDDSLIAAIDELASRPSLGAVTLHPRHPNGGRSEWPFRVPPGGGGGTDAWPFMGCANLVRRDAWMHVGGFEPAFFLYRNDTDLALKLLASTRGVHFNPSLIVWHDSPSGPGSPKSIRWHQLATRNWIWMARRHSGMGFPAHILGFLGALLGWLWAHKLAGFSIPRHTATLRGLWSGITTPAPTLGTLTPDGRPWRTLLSMHFRRSEK